MINLSIIDYGIFVCYLIGSILVSRCRLKKASEENTAGSVEDYFLDGRKLSLPVFVASLVSTWYGGILGVGEVNYSFGASRWLMLEAPYYFFALVFAVFVVSPIRASKSLSLPDYWKLKLNSRIGALGSFLIFILTSPAPYLWMLGVLLQQIFPLSLGQAILISCVFVGATQYRNGFQSVRRSNTLDFLIMFGGFALILPFCWWKLGGSDYLHNHLPKSHLEFVSNESWQAYGTWFFVAAWTLVDPGFHQRVRAARSSKVARIGLLVSLLFWMIFDSMTLLVALYAKAAIPDLKNAGLCYISLAAQILPVGIFGLFFISLVATVFSTLNSFTFLSAQMLSQLLKLRWKQGSLIQLHRVALVSTLVLACALVVFIPSAIGLWYFLGSILLPGLLLGLVASLGYLGFISNTTLWYAMILSAITSLLTWLDNHTNRSILGVLSGCQPMFAGFVIVLFAIVFDKLRGSEAK